MGQFETVAGLLGNVCFEPNPVIAKIHAAEAVTRLRPLFLDR